MSPQEMTAMKTKAFSLFRVKTWPGWPTLATYEFPVLLYFLLYGYVVQWQTAFATATTGCTFPMRAVR